MFRDKAKDGTIRITGGIPSAGGEGPSGPPGPTGPDLGQSELYAAIGLDLQTRLGASSDPYLNMVFQQEDATLQPDRDWFSVSADDMTVLEKGVYLFILKVTGNATGTSGSGSTGAIRFTFGMTIDPEMPPTWNFNKKFFIEADPANALYGTSRDFDGGELTIIQPLDVGDIVNVFFGTQDGNAANWDVMHANLFMQVIKLSDW